MGAFEHDSCLLSKRKTLGWIFGIEPRCGEGEWNGVVDLVLEPSAGEFCIICGLFPAMASLKILSDCLVGGSREEEVLGCVYTGYFCPKYSVIIELVADCERESGSKVTRISDDLDLPFRLDYTYGVKVRGSARSSFRSLTHLVHLYVTNPDPVISRNLSISRLIGYHNLQTTSPIGATNCTYRRIGRTTLHFND